MKQFKKIFEEIKFQKKILEKIQIRDKIFFTYEISEFIYGLGYKNLKTGEIVELKNKKFGRISFFPSPNKKEIAIIILEFYNKKINNNITLEQTKYNILDYNFNEIIVDNFDYIGKIEWINNENFIYNYYLHDKTKITAINNEEICSTIYGIKNVYGNTILEIENIEISDFGLNKDKKKLNISLENEEEIFSSNIINNV